MTSKVFQLRSKILKKLGKKSLPQIVKKKNFCKYLIFFFFFQKKTRQKLKKMSYNRKFFPIRNFCSANGGIIENLKKVHI